MKKQIITATALAATLATAALPTTSVFAAETVAPIQQQESQVSIQPFAQSNLETAVQAALNGPEVKKKKYLSIEFVKKLKLWIEVQLVKMYTDKSLII